MKKTAIIALLFTLSYAINGMENGPSSEEKGGSGISTVTDRTGNTEWQNLTETDYQNISDEEEESTIFALYNKITKPIELDPEYKQLYDKFVNEYRSSFGQNPNISYQDYVTRFSELDDLLNDLAEPINKKGTLRRAKSEGELFKKNRHQTHLMIAMRSLTPEPERKPTRTESVLKLLGITKKQPPIEQIENKTINPLFKNQVLVRYFNYREKPNLKKHK